MVPFTWQLVLAVFALFVEGFRIKNKKLNELLGSFDDRQIADKATGHPVEQVLAAGGGGGGGFPGSGYAVGAMGAVADAEDNTTFGYLLQPGTTNQVVSKHFGDAYLHLKNGKDAKDHFWNDGAPANREARTRHFFDQAEDIAEGVPALEADPRLTAAKILEDADAGAAAKDKQAVKEKQAAKEKNAKEKLAADTGAFAAVKRSPYALPAVAAEATPEADNAGGRTGSGTGPRKRRLHPWTPLASAGISLGVGMGVVALSAYAAGVAQDDLLKACARTVVVAGAGFESTHPECTGDFTLDLDSPLFGGLHGGRPIYQNDKGRYLFFWNLTGRWRIGIDTTSDVFDMESSSKWAAMCPTQATGWEGFHGDMWHPDIWCAM